MARTLLPTPLSRREWIEQPLDAERARAVAEAYLAERRAPEALIFLSKAGDRERLATVRGEAVESGDAFLLREACRELGEEPTLDEWRRLRDAAAAAGKETYAAEAQRQIDRMEV